ncbi:MAG TPA: transglutaminase-like domain-containing protein, partial [Bacteroidota bacterium]|nr:transglutaminase-like domain-containing protein [Bacteroidota bacterium]
ANEKIQAIATFVRDDIRYVAVEIGKGRWQPRPAATTLHNRFGDCKDKTTLMREMLKAAGIPSRAVLANTTHSVKPDLPTPFQFNHCIVAIPRSALSEPAAWADACAGGWFFFDPTHPSTRPGQIPDGLLGDYVLIASENDSTFYRLPERSPDSYRRAYDIVATLAQDGSVSAEVNVRDYGLRAADTRYEFSTTPPEKEKLAWTQYLSKLNPGVDITEYRNGSAGDTAWESFRIRYPKYLVHAGGLNLLKPDLIHSGEPPLLTREQRVHPINFGSARLTATSILWHLPPGWAVEGDMVPLSAGCESGNVEARVRVSNDTLRYDLTETYTGAMLGASQYGVARKFNRDLSSAKGMTLLIKRP